MASPCFYWYWCFVFVPAPDCPLWMRRGAEGQTDQGKNLFERSELFLTPAGPSTAGCPQRSGGTQQPGSPFFCLLFFGEAKKSELPPGNPGQQNSAKPTPVGQTKKLSTYRQRLQAQAPMRLPTGRLDL